jgi:hypothetical protein
VLSTRKIVIRRQKAKVWMALFTTTLGLYGGVLWSGELQGLIIHQMMPNIGGCNLKTAAGNCEARRRRRRRDARRERRERGDDVGRGGEGARARATGRGARRPALPLLLLLPSFTELHSHFLLATGGVVLVRAWHARHCRLPSPPPTTGPSTFPTANCNCQAPSWKLRAPC